ncbi:MAG: TerB family tellurite resistance protein [Labilithrix sp.]|nr:TerB family tellurite resistance protein [Labilithrix sp.]
MKRLTISGDACIETLALLITMAWADGRLDDQEREGVRAAASVFNLTKELRERLDQLLEKPIGIDELLVDDLSARDKAFAYVAAAWLAGVDDDVHAKEEELLGKLGLLLGFTDERRNELAGIARDLEPLRKDGASWATEIVTLFKAIPSRLEGDGTENYEVAFE